MWIALSVIFALGVANFALHRAVLDSGHPMLEQMPGFARAKGGRITLTAEFVLLLVALLLAANGWPQFAWFYAAYSALNALAAWLMISGRV